MLIASPDCTCISISCKICVGVLSGPDKVREILSREIILLSLFRIFILIVVFNFNSVSHANDKTASKILLFGDSIIAGYGLSQEDSLPARLEELLKKDGYNVHIINGGVSGDTTGSGLSRLKWTLEKHNPNIVLLALGGNDVLRGFSPDVTKRNIETMLKILKEKDVQVVFSEVQAPLNLGINYKRKFDSIYADLSDKYDVPTYPFLLDKTFGDKALMQSDQIHPNAAGVNVIVKDLSEYLIDYLK